jgi:pyruvate kinase
MVTLPPEAASDYGFVRDLLSRGALGGSAAATVVARVPKGVLVEVTHSKGKKLKPEKGLNFPDPDLNVHTLTEKDRADLDTAARLADLIGYSFV